MFISTEPTRFEPKDFMILNFYGRDTCFAWNENEFVCFPYLDTNSTIVSKVLRAPAKIKDIRGFDKRIFILCYPNGIYKLTDSYEFASLSKAGIELGSNFSEVFTPNNGMLILEDKKLKSTKKLFPTTVTSNIHVLSLRYDSTDKSLYKILLPNDCNSIVNFCIFSHDQKLFKMHGQTIQIIYNCDYSIKSIKPVERNEEIFGIILQTDTNIAIFMHVVEKKLIYDKIYLGTNVQTICAVIDGNIENVLVLVHSDGVRTYYTTKMLTRDSVSKVRTEEKHYESFRLYKSKFVVFLNDSKMLVQVHIERLRDAYNENTGNFVELKASMLNGIEEITEIMSNKTRELKKLREEIIDREDRLKRINLFSTKECLKYCPQDCVKRLLNQVFLISNFKRVLPENSVVVKMLKSREKTIFAMKIVKDTDTVVEMPICLTNLSSNLYTMTDLITHRRNGGIWCLIKNYIKDPLTSENNKMHLAGDKRKLIKYKLLVLENLIEENKVSLEALGKIKRAVRREM